MKLKGLKITIILLIILLIAGVGGFAFVYLKTDLLLTNQQGFNKYLGQEYEVVNNLFNFYKAQEISEESYESDINASVIYEGDEEKINIGANINTKKNGENIFSEITTNYEDEEFLKFNYLKEGDKHGIQFPGVMQYVVLENAELKEFAKKLGLEDEEALKLIPNKISGIYPDELIELSDEEKEQIKNLVIDAISNNIQEDRYMKDKAVNIKVNEQNIEATGYSVEITEKDMLNITKTILEEVKGNEVFLNIIENKIDYIMYGENIDIFTAYLRLGIGSSIMLQSGTYSILSGEQEENEEEFPSFEINKDIIVEGLESAIENMQEELEEAKDTEGIKITIYQKSGKTVKIKIEQTAEQENYSFYSFDEEDEEADISIVTNTIELDILTNEGNRSNLLITIQSYVDEELQSGQSMQITIENGNGKNILRQNTQDLTNENVKSSNETIVTRSGNNINITTNVESILEESRLYSDSDPYTIETSIKFENNIKIGDVSIEESLENNEVIVNNLTLEQIENIFKSILKSVEGEIQETFQDFSIDDPYGNKELLEKAEEAKEANSKAELLDAVKLAKTQLYIEENGTYIYNIEDIADNGKLVTAIRSYYSGDIVIIENNGNLEVRDSDDSTNDVIIELTDNEITNISTLNE